MIAVIADAISTNNCKYLSMLGISVTETARIAGVESNNNGLIVIFVCFCVYFFFVAAGGRPVSRDVFTKKESDTHTSISLISVYRAGLTLPDSDVNILFFCKEQKTTYKQ